MASQQHSGIMTPLNGRSSMISRPISSISTPRLTPLKDPEYFKYLFGGVSKVDITALEEKIKGIEDQIQRAESQNKGLEKLHRCLEKTINKDLVEQSRNDISLLGDDEILQNDLVNFENLELLQLRGGNEISDEDFSKLSLKQAVSRLFKFVEIESNISLELLDSRYNRLKDRIMDQVKLAEEAIELRDA